MKTYEEELVDLHHRRVYYILLASVIIMVLFSPLDYLIAVGRFREFLFCRIAGAFIGLVLLLVNFYDRQKKYAAITGFSAYMSLCLVILAMIHQMGGVTSPYYVGLILAMTIYAALAPLTTQQTLASGLLPVVLYAAVVLLAEPSPPRAGFLLELYRNLFFIISVVFIIATQSWADTRARRREYQLRVQENEAARQLSRQAEVLEHEVTERSREQAQSEARYRLLFNQIADDVVLITPAGQILQANSNFILHYGGERSAATGSLLFELIPDYARAEIRILMGEMLTTGEPVRNRLLPLINRDGKIIEAEMSATLLHRDQTVVGILLLIRDMSIRREMEQRLLASLEIRKKTETAAILALAKLSEFRDVTSSNHLERIREYCRILAMELRSYPELESVMTPTYIEDIYHASILHDIGKVAIPDTPAKREAMTEEGELDLIRRHAIAGGDVIKEMQEESKGSSFLDMAKYIAYFHHEQWDGKGYPHGLRQRQIPLAARIMALADTYEELTASTVENPFRASHEDAIEEILAGSGLRFDPMVVGAFMARQEDFRAIQKKFN